MSRFHLTDRPPWLRKCAFKFLQHLTKSAPEVVISSQNADGLQRLSETHVIAEDPMQLVFV